MPKIPGTIIAAKVTTGDTANTFAIGDQNEMQGGQHSVQSLSDRDAITVERRIEGMTCYVADSKQMFQLVGGTTNGDWIDQASLTADQLYKTTVLAWAGTATADTALSVAGQGTDLAYNALQEAWYGTDAAARVAYPALVTSWVGTATANVALSVASTGTLGVVAAIDLANKALVVAEGGTMLRQMQDVNIPAPTNSQVLAWDGSKWVAMDAPSTTAPSAFTYYLDDTPSGTAGYSTLLSQPSGIPEKLDVVTVSAATSPVYDDSYISAELQRTLIDSGVWEFNIYASVDVPPGTIIFDILKRSIGGAETYLFSGTTDRITSLAPQILTSILAEPQFACTLQDKLLARFYYATDSVTPVNITLYHNGTAHYTHFHTPLRTAHNDLAGIQGGQPEERYHTTADQNAALVGTDGHPSASDPFVTTSDSRLAAGALAYNISRSGTDAAIAGIDLANKALILAEVGTATGDVALYVAGVGTNLAQRAYDLASQNPATPNAGNWLLSGGQVIWVSGYNFEVGPTVVAFGGTAVSFGSEAFTLAPADLVDNRLDLIVADRIYGTVAVIEGTASTPAFTPEYDPVNQFELTFIPVDANTSSPGDVDIQWIYRENAEWTLAGSVGPYVNVNSTTNPYSGSKCIEVTGALTNTTIRYQAAADFEINNYSTLFMYLKPKTAWGSNYVRIDFERTNGSMFGKYVVIKHGFLGFDANNLNYQLIAIPISLFGVPVGSAVRGIRFNCQNFSGAQNWRLDDIGLQLGIASTAQPVPDATTNAKGIVQLEVNGGTVPGRAVTGDDYRLALGAAGTTLAYTALTQAWYGTQAAAQIGYPALVTAWVGTATANVALRVGANGTNGVNWEGTNRVNADQVLQNEINALNAALGISFQGTFSLFMANFRNGPPDNRVSVVNGVVTGLTPSYYIWEDFENYPTGTLPPLTLGSAWDGAGTIITNPGFGIQAEDQILYSAGTVVVLSGGTGWLSYGTIIAR